MRHPFLSLIAPLTIWLALANPVAAAESTARATVENFHAALLEVMKNADTLGIKGRYGRLEPQVSRSFNLALTIRIASGIHWRKANAAQRIALVDAFKRFSIGVYAARFSSHSGETFETSSVKPGPQRTKLVHTRINRPKDSPVKLSYVVKNFSGAWRIVDVLLDGGISELAVRRSEYRSILNTNGIEGLVATLNRKAGDLMNK
jgi:phospholipid transport system substrate-binding protein